MTLEVEELALEVLNAWDTGEPLEPFTSREPGLDTAAAYDVALAIRAQRLERGESHLGRKIGFTNRTIWPVYGVGAPIWGDMWDRTVFEHADEMEFLLDGLMEPRLEPEIVFGLARTLEPGMDDAAILACCDWIAHGGELVQSPFPGWKFQAPDTICAGGLHGALVIGERRPVDPSLAAVLANFTCTLSRDGEAVETGHSANVLGSPLRALAHLADLLADDAKAPLRAGEIVTTGTLTDAYPLAPGQHWTTRLDGLDLPGLDIRLV